MYELIILSHLMRQPAHGYMIASIINDMIGPYARISNGRLHPLLSKLEKSGLIVPYFLKSSERLRLIDHYINYCQAHVLHITAEADDFVQQSPNWGSEWNSSRFKAVLDVMQHVIDQWQLELDWATVLRERELARIESNESGVQVLEQSSSSMIQHEENYRPEGD